MSKPFRRIAMWSGPRNISTAMMRAWGNRSDTYVCDEPFYANYLKVTQLAHPIAEKIIAHDENDWKNVVDYLMGDIPSGMQTFYQKQMTHHLLPHIDRSWLASVTNCFLIRAPQDVITSYIKKNQDPTLEDTGFPQQWEIYQWVRQHTGTTPLVLDARDVLDNPRNSLELLCDGVGVEFQESMLAWEPGLRDTDGIWAEHWYTEVQTSTGFRPYQAKTDRVPDHLKRIEQQCQEVYERLYKQRIH